MSYDNRSCGESARPVDGGKARAFAGDERRSSQGARRQDCLRIVRYSAGRCAGSRSKDRAELRLVLVVHEAAEIGRRIGAAHRRDRDHKRKRRKCVARSAVLLHSAAVSPHSATMQNVLGPIPPLTIYRSRRQDCSTRRDRNRGNRHELSASPTPLPNRPRAPRAWAKAIIWAPAPHTFRTNARRSAHLLSPVDPPTWGPDWIKQRPALRGTRRAPQPTQDPHTTIVENLEKSRQVSRYKICTSLAAIISVIICGARDVRRLQHHQRRRVDARARQRIHAGAGRSEKLRRSSRASGDLRRARRPLHAQDHRQVGAATRSSRWPSCSPS